MIGVPVLGFPFEPITLHQYLYANGDPISVVDPSGYYGISNLMASVNVRAIQASYSVASYARILNVVEKTLTIVEALQTIGTLSSGQAWNQVRDYIDDAVNNSALKV